MADSMAKSKQYKSGLLGLAGTNYPAILRGTLVGALIGLIVPTLAKFLLVVYDRFSGELLDSVQWPRHTWVFLVVILISATSLYLPHILGFCRKVLASWRVMPADGLFWVWLLFTPSLVTLISEGRSKGSVLLSALPLTLSIALLIWANTLKTFTSEKDLDPDDPIETWDLDILGRRSLISRLAEEVSSGAASVIALVGPYGHGKTSTLNLLTQALKEGHPEIVVAHFVSSLATSKEVLVGTLFNSIAKELQKRFVHESLPAGLAQYARSVVSVVPRFGDTLKELFRAPSQDDLIQQLRRSLGELRVRLAVMVDDMDRMHTEELEVLLKLMRCAGEFSNLTYVCAFDKEALVRELGGQMSPDEARQYLEKFFPLQVPLPKIDVGVLGREFDKRFKRLCVNFALLPTEEEQRRFDEKFGPLWQVHINRCFSNLRRIKLFFNRLSASIGPIAHEINLMDFVLVEIVRDLSPDLYEKVYIHRRYFFYGSWDVGTWWQTLHPNDQEAAKLRNQFLGELLQPLDVKKELITKLLSELFPVVAEYCGDQLGGGAADSRESKNNRRIFHPAFFARYFIFGVQSDQFGEAEFDNFTSDLNSFTAVETCKNRFKEEFETLPAESLRRRNFLDQLANKIHRFAPLQAEVVGTAVAELSDQLEPPILGLAEAETALRIIFAVADKFADTSKVQDFLEMTIQDSTADYFAALILAACKDPSKNGILTKWENVNFDRLRESFRQRLKLKYFARGPNSIFDPTNRKGAIQSLQLWAQAGGMEEVRSYLRDEFTQRPQGLGTLMSFMFPTEESASIETLKPLSDLFPLRELEMGINKYGKDVWASPEEESSIRRFAQLMASARMHSVRFEMPQGRTWFAKNDDGTQSPYVNGQVVLDVRLAEDGQPADKNLREAVALGEALIIPPLSWVDAG